MKKMIKLLTLGATVAVLALPVAAKNVLVGSEIVAQDQCTQENKDAYYAAFREARTTDQPKAYENAKKYLACPPGAEVTEASQKIIDYLKKWVTAYEEGTEEQRLPQLLYNDRKYPEAYELGKKILARKPDNLKVQIDLGANGYLLVALKNPALNNEAIGYAKQALVQLESGKSLEDWRPLSGKDEAIAYLNYTLGVFSLEPDPVTALKHLIKAAQFETPLKKSPFTYAYIGGAYEAGSYAKLSDEYKKFTGKDETPESKLLLANINQIVDRMIDAYARAVALGGDPKFADQKKVWAASLSDWYKYRHQSETGMNEMVTSILSKPLPPEPTPLTSLPATPAATPIGTSGATPTNGASTLMAPTNTPASAPASGTANKTTTVKTAKTGPAKPKNHR